MKSKHVLTILITFLLLQGCATYEKVLNTWIGHPIDEFVLKNGTPTSIYTLSNGDKIYEFIKTVKIPYTTYKPVTTYGSLYNYYSGFSSMSSTTYIPHTEYHDYYCHTRLFVDSLTNKIKSWEYRGNWCW